MNILKVTVDNADELLNTSSFGAGALIRVESSATGGGIGFSEVGTVAIVAATYLYTYYDQSAASGTYYRSRYSNAGNTNRSDYSDEFQANTSLANYASIYDLKQRLSIPATDTTDDENLIQVLAWTTGWIDSYTGRTFLPDPSSGTRTYVFDGYDAVEGGRCLLIPQGIRSISSMTIATNTGAAGQSIPTPDLFIRPNVQERVPGWPGTEIWMTDIPTSNPVPYFAQGYSNISITGTFGWSAIPSEIEDVCLNVSVSKWRGRGSGGGDSFTIGGDGERTFERLLSYQDRATLRRYMIRPVVIV